MFRTLPLKAQMAALGVAVALPLAGAFAWRTYADREARVLRAEETALTFAKLARSRYELVLVDSRQALEHLASRAELPDRARCATELQEVHGLLPQFAAVSLNARGGDVICSSPVMPAGTTLAKLPWRPKGSRGLTVSHPLVGPVSGRRIAILSVPLTYRDGWVAASLDLNHFDASARTLGLPDGAVISVFNRDGTLVARHPERPDLVGRTYRDLPLVRTARRSGEGILHARGLTGQPMIYGFSRIEPLGWTVAAGLPFGPIKADTEAAAIRSASIFGLVLLALALPLVAAYRWFIGAVRILSATANAVERADWSTVLADTGPRELRATIAPLNRVLSQHGELEAEVRRREAIIQGVFDTCADGIVVADATGTVRLLNRSAALMFGYDAEAALGMSVASFLVPAERDRVPRLFADGPDAPVGAPRREEMRGLRSDGRTFPFSLTVGAFDVGAERLFAGLVHDLTERKEQELALTDALGDLRRLSRQLVDVQEKERRTIARELHDQIGQLLTAAQMRLRVLLRRKRIDPSDEEARRLADILDGAIEEVRSLSRSLRPEQLDHLGLAPALQALAQDMFEGSGLAWTVDADALGRPPEAVSLALYRIAQEALTNVVRHARAARVEVAGRALPTDYVLTITDDGAGFRPAARTRQGVGLEGMRERAALLGGSVELASAIGAGTTLTVRLPRHEPR
ncbi:MAG TPA: PAS domain S-box protein [Lysobacter sp.]|nr:PAS domain S-box protein [Lysobacter sp.]